LAWALLIIGSNPVIAQDEPARPAPRERDTEEQLERPDFLPPNLPYPGLPRRNVYRGSSTLRPRGLYPYYRYPFGYNIFGDEDYYGDASADAYERGYRDGYRDGRRAEQFERAYEYGRASYLDAVQDGIGAFRSGDYGEAARQFLLATELHRGDPVSHLHAVHALTAQGRYDEAAAMLRRALQLQPKIVFLPADIRREYGREQDFNDHLHRLEQAAQSGEGAADLWMLLGYYQFFSDRRGDALRSFSRAAELANGPDPVIDRFTDAARASVPRERDQRAPSNAPR
jgi:tetratricopeptide (TPR) repeat protein